MISTTSNEHKSNMNYVWNFLSDAAKAKLGELAMADKESIVAEKMFNGRSCRWSCI